MTSTGMKGQAETPIRAGIRGCSFGYYRPEHYQRKDKTNDTIKYKGKLLVGIPI